MWGDLIFLISPFIMLKFADNLTITFLTETFICKTSINYKLFCLISVSIKTSQVREKY